MIPKIIHYCWFGRGKMPELAEHCLASWRKFLPDYELKLWNEDSFDVNRLRFMHWRNAEGRIRSVRKRS